MEVSHQKMVAGNPNKLLIAPGCFMLDWWGVSGALHIHARASGVPHAGVLHPSRLSGAPWGPSLTLEFVDKQPFNVCQYQSHTLRSLAFSCKTAAQPKSGFGPKRPLETSASSLPPWEAPCAGVLRAGSPSRGRLGRSALCNTIVNGHTSLRCPPESRGVWIPLVRWLRHTEGCY